MSSLIVPVVTIKELQKIDGADRIVLAKFHENDWQVIVDKATSFVGKVLIYVPPETVLPQSIVEKYGLDYVKNGRVRSIKLKGVYSFGLTLPVPDGPEFRSNMNMAEYLGASKYEEPINTNGGKVTKKGNAVAWPKIVEKYTDIENGRNFTDVFRPNELVCVTEKIHGSNFQAGWVEITEMPWWRKIIVKWFPSLKYKFIVFSRKVAYTINQKDNKWSEIARKYDLGGKLKMFPGYVVCGEIYGRGVQDLTYGLNDVRLVFYDIQKAGSGYLDWDVTKSVFASLGLAFDLVPELYVGPWNVEKIKSIVSGTTQLGYNVDQMREGIVVKPVAERYSETLHGRAIVKFISPEYLARKDGTEHH